MRVESVFSLLKEVRICPVIGSPQHVGVCCPYMVIILVLVHFISGNQYPFADKGLASL